MSRTTKIASPAEPSSSSAAAAGDDLTRLDEKLTKLLHEQSEANTAAIAKATADLQAFVGAAIATAMAQAMAQAASNTAAAVSAITGKGVADKGAPTGSSSSGDSVAQTAPVASTSSSSGPLITAPSAAAAASGATAGQSAPDELPHHLVSAFEAQSIARQEWAHLNAERAKQAAADLRIIAQKGKQAAGAAKAVSKPDGETFSTFTTKNNVQVIGKWDGTKDSLDNWAERATEALEDFDESGPAKVRWLLKHAIEDKVVKTYRVRGEHCQDLPEFFKLLTTATNLSGNVDQEWRMATQGSDETYDDYAGRLRAIHIRRGGSSTDMALMDKFQACLPEETCSQILYQHDFAGRTPTFESMVSGAMFLTRHKVATPQPPNTAATRKLGQVNAVEVAPAESIMAPVVSQLLAATSSLASVTRDMAGVAREMAASSRDIGQFVSVGHGWNRDVPV
jgi:hypothetical protein